MHMCCSKKGDVRTLHPPISCDDDQPATDFSWVCPDNTMMCWEKFHSFYLLNKLHLANLQLYPPGSNMCHFSRAQPTSKLYKNKMAALGRQVPEKDRKHMHVAGGEHGGASTEEKDNGDLSGIDLREVRQMAAVCLALIIAWGCQQRCDVETFLEIITFLICLL